VAVRSSGSLDRKTLHLLIMVNPIEEQRRQDRLDAWYKKDGREDKNHPLYSLYTGLAGKYGDKESNA
jgi:hypothetical protein